MTGHAHIGGTVIRHPVPSKARTVESQDRQKPGPSKIRGVELATEHDSDASSVATFQVEQVSTGAQASGFGSTEDNRPFAFRVYKRTLYLEIYRADLPSPVPDRSDVTAVAEQSVTEIDLTDERSIVAAVRDAVGSADSLGADAKESSAVRSFLGRVGSVMASI
ncbi:MAG: hypothetical protein ABW188_17830 [Rhodococcus fascians]